MSNEKAEILMGVIRHRRSIRKYTEQDVPEPLLQQILEAGWNAPSAGNRQPVEYIIVRDETTKRKLSRQPCVTQAPVVVVVVTDNERTTSRYGNRGERMYVYHDAAAAIQNMLLMIDALDLGACWIGAFNDVKVAEALELPASIMPHAIIPIGYPAEQPSPPRKIPLEKITHIEKYEKKQIKDHFISLVE
ncbi:MAG: nitroreductase family protein [Candidatus Heimdallarchaeaceae archaeon]